MDSKKKILIIEDEKHIAEAYSNFLISEGGYDVSCAYDGEEGLAKIKEYKPDLILLDIVMPKIDGVTLVSTLKEDKELGSIPVIVLTNLESSETMRQLLDMGIEKYLVKTDYSLDDVLEKVKSVLEK